MFSSVLNKHAPLQKLSCKQKQLNGKLYVIQRHIDINKTKHTLLQNIIKTKMEKHKKQYQKYRNKLTHIIEIAKKNTLLTNLNNHSIILDFYGRLQMI